MKRDVDLVRDILLKVEEMPPGSRNAHLAFDGVDDQIVGAHVAMLIEAGLIEGRATQAFAGNYRGVMVSRLTWEGHEFLDAIRDQTVWRKTKETLLSKAGALSFEMVKAVATQIVRSQLGLPPG